MNITNTFIIKNKGCICKYCLIDLGSRELTMNSCIF